MLDIGLSCDVHLVVIERGGAEEPLSNDSNITISHDMKMSNISFNDISKIKSAVILC